jgi:hypothetical protein
MSFEGLLSLRKPYEREVEVQEPTLGQEVTEVAREAFEFSPVQSIVRGLDLAEARRTGNILDANSARAQLDDAGLRDQLTVPDQGITQEALDILIRRKRIENRRAELFSRSPGGFTRGTAKIATAIGTSIFDPINVASAFVPVVSQARYMQMLRAQAGVVGRTGVRAGVGFVEGAAGAALVEPLILGVAQAEQADYDGVDSLLNIAFGGVFGGGLHAVGGLGYEASRRLRGLEALPPREQIDAAVQQAIIDADEVLPKPVDVPEPVQVPVTEKFKPTAIKPVDAYIESAKQISQELRRTLNIDINDAKAVSKATGEKAVSIAEFVKRTGGIVDDGGELSARDVTNKRYPGLVRKDTPENRQTAGMDSVRERLYDAGYFPERESYNDISDSEIFDALAEDLSGTRIWSGAVREKLNRFIGNKEYITQMEMEGFSRDMSVTQIADRLRMMDDAARAEADQPTSIDPDALLEYERIAAELNAQTSAANVIDSVNPETRRAALTTGVAQAIDARNIDVEPIVSLDPKLARGGEEAPLRSAKNAAIQNFSWDQRTMVDPEAAAETPQPSRQPMLDAADSALADARASADEAIKAVNAESEVIPSRLVQEKPATYTTNEDLQRYLSEGPVETQSGPRAVAAQRAAVRAVEDLQSSGDVLGLALSRDFAARQRVSLVGQRIASTEDFATLAQVYRDPRFETLRYVFVDNKGNVVGQAGVTSRLPATTNAFVGPDSTDFFDELGSRANQLGAKKVYLLHNHPSAISDPSQADIKFTKTVASYFKTRGIEFADHVIIDTNEYSVIKADGQFETIKKDFGQPSHARLKKMADDPINSAQRLASLARQLQFDDQSVVLIVLNNQLIVQNIAEIPYSKVMSYGNTPEGKRAALFALRKLTLSSEGSFLLALSKNQDALMPLKDVVLDGLVIDQTGFTTSVYPFGRTKGRVFPASRRGRFSPETSASFDYLRQISATDAMRNMQIFEEGAAYNAGNLNDEMRPFNEAIDRANLYARAVRAAAERISNMDAARAAIESVSRGELTASEIDILLDRLKQENARVRSRLRQAKEEFTAEDKIDTLESDAVKAANSLANNIKLDATIAARNAALSLSARVKAAGRILTQFRDNPSEGLLSLLGGSSFARFGSKDSVFHWQRTYFTRWTKGMLADLERDGLAEAFTSNAYGRDVARALYQLGRDEPALEGLDQNAVKIAKIVYKYREDSRNTRNRFGAWIRDLTGYITRQQHDFMKIRAAGAKEWKDFVRQRLDIERSLQPGQNLEEFLDTVYADLAAGRHLSAIDEEAQAYTTPGSLARRVSQSRVIYFKDADAEFDYLTQFGVGKLHEAILGDLSRAAQQAGLMRILGPNPQFTLKAVASEVEAGLVRDPEMRQKFAESKDTAEGLLSMLDGRANVPGNAMSARVGSNVRVTQAMAKLGGAVISAVTDLPVYASQIKYQGRGGLLSGIGEGISALLQGRAKGERKRILNMIDTVADNLVGGVATRFDSDDLMSAGSADLMRIFFRLNGLQWWTDTLRESMELGTANWMGNLRNTSYDRLSADTKRLFEQYGITTAEWDVMRQATVDAADKRIYVVPEQLNKLDLDVFKTYLSAIGREPTDAAAATAKRDLADRLRGFIIDQAMTAVIEPDVRSRYFWTRGLRPGTFWGETARYIAQFKGFPTALTRQVFGREIYGRGYNSLSDYMKYGKADMLGLAQLILMMSAFGYAAMAAKDLLKGKTPRDPAKPETWLAAMLQGGALGIYGDFLLGQSNRFGRNIIDTLAGPTFGLIGDLDELRQRAMRGDDVAASAFRTLISNTPFMNLFYARIVLDYLVLYQIQEALNPGYLRRMERRIEREQGQEFLLAPSEAVQ